MPFTGSNHRSYLAVSHSSREWMLMARVTTSCPEFSMPSLSPIASSRTQRFRGFDTPIYHIQCLLMDLSSKKLVQSTFELGYATSLCNSLWQ